MQWNTNKGHQVRYFPLIFIDISFMLLFLPTRTNNQINCMEAKEMIYTHFATGLLSRLKNNGLSYKTW